MSLQLPWPSFPYSPPDLASLPLSLSLHTKRTYYGSSSLSWVDHWGRNPSCWLQ